MKAKIIIMPKSGVFDPQGNAIDASLQNSGYTNMTNIRCGKYIELEIDSNDRQTASLQVDEVCKKFLANETIERYNFTLEE